MRSSRLVRIEPASRAKVIALVGPRNCGKSTLFNRLTGLRQDVGNYPGVTVEYRSGRLFLPSGHADLIDLPGVSSLTARSDDEQVTLDVLEGRIPKLSRPDAIVLVLDANAVERGLPLAVPVLALGLPTLVVLNKSDEFRSRGGVLDVAELAARLRVRVGQISAKRGEGLDCIRAFAMEPAGLSSGSEFPRLADLAERRRWASRMAAESGYRRPARSVWTARIDRVALHRIAGPALFGAVLVAVFQSLTVLARPVQEWCARAIQLPGDWLTSVMPPSPVRSLLMEGVWPGVGSVLAFLPQILILFLLIGILEDSGYMARAAVIADRTMSRFGLQGKSFIPLLSACACAIPAIMATRTIENKRDRLATILVAPFMTCSARLPVYTMVIAAFIPERALLGPLLGTRAAAMLGLYGLGFLGAMGTAWTLRSGVLPWTASGFLMEMPVYRWPSVRSLAFRLLERAKVFVFSAGTIILAVSIGLWLLSRLPLRQGQFSDLEHSVAGILGRAMEPLLRPLGLNWKIAIGLVTSFAAREVIVGTLGELYSGGAAPVNLAAALRRDLTPGGAAALVVFFAFALQCFSTLAVVRRETGSWKWPLAQFVYMSVVAYLSAWATNHLVNAVFG